MEKYLVCQGCLFAVAYDDFSVIDVEKEEDCRAGLRALSENGNLVCGEDSIEFSTHTCECCGDKLHGSRHEIFVI